MEKRIQMKREWHYSQNDFFELVNHVKELMKDVERLKELVERQGNQIENAFNIFSEEGKHY